LKTVEKKTNKIQTNNLKDIIRPYYQIIQDFPFFVWMDFLFCSLHFECEHSYNLNRTKNIQGNSQKNISKIWFCITLKKEYIFLFIDATDF